jgi:CheY-like chemotaxis protein
VVDDEAAVRTLLDAGLRYHGFAVWPAADGAEAVDLYRRHAGEIALALLDVKMPGMDGPETLRALRAVNPGLACCFMTGDAGRYAEADLLALGAAHVIRKPFSLAETAQRLRELAGWPERRTAPRLAEPQLRVAVREGPEAAVRDRSREGLGLWLARPLPVGTVLAVRPAGAPEATPWVELRVKHCRPHEHGWAVGCQFVRPPDAEAPPFRP